MPLGRTGGPPISGISHIIKALGDLGGAAREEGECARAWFRVPGQSVHLRSSRRGREGGISPICTTHSCPPRELIRLFSDAAGGLIEASAREQLSSHFCMVRESTLSLFTKCKRSVCLPFYTSTSLRRDKHDEKVTKCSREEKKGG